MSGHGENTTQTENCLLACITQQSKALIPAWLCERKLTAPAMTPRWKEDLIRTYSPC